MNNNSSTASFRDNSGFIFQKDEIFYRQVNKSYKKNYDFLISSGLYDKLSSNKLLISHQEIANDINDIDCYKILKPIQLNFITCPSSWSFGMLKDAALLTLNIQKQAILHGMILKDASNYNVQFQDGRAIFIDTLSFEKLEVDTSWIAYGQFCRHFMAPLALLSFVDINLGKQFILYLDGIPLDLTTKLLPFKSIFNLGLLLHIYLHNKFIQNNNFQNIKVQKSYLSTKDLLNQTESLIDTVKKIALSNKQTEWELYYEKNVSSDYFEHKKLIVENFISKINTNNLLDLGANDGTFSLIAAKTCKKVLAFDIDPLVIEKLYQKIKKDKIKNVFPLIIDITNPEPAIGWMNEERTSILQRIKIDTIMVLALIHHLRITCGIPLQKIVQFLSYNCENMIIEFIPKSDPKVQFLLRNREDIFNDYDETCFITVFQEKFEVISQQKVNSTNRVLYLMKKK